MLSKSLINVMDAYFYSPEGKLLMVHENLTNADIKGSASESEITNGRGGSTYATISSKKTLTVELKSNVFDFGLLCLQCGVQPTKAIGNFYTEAKTYTIAANKITLDQTPITVASVQIVDTATDVVLDNSKYTITGKDVTFTGVTGIVKVVPYLYTATEQLETVTIEADKFSSAGKLVLKTVEVDANQKPINYVEIIIERAKPSSDFTISAGAELTGQDANITLKALKDVNGNLGYIRRRPIA